MTSRNTPSFADDTGPHANCAFRFDAYEACANFVSYVNPHDWPFRAPLFFNPAPHQTYSPQSDFYGQQSLSENESRKQEEEGDDDQPEGQLQDRKIFIGGLPYDLVNYFSQWGKIVDSVVIKDRVTGKSRGFGFVVYQTIGMLEVAMRNRPHVLRNKVVDSKMAISREQIKATKSPQNTPRSPANKNFSRQKQSNNRQRVRQPPKPSLSPSEFFPSFHSFHRQSNE